MKGSAVRSASKSRTDIPWLSRPTAANTSKATMSPLTRNATRLQKTRKEFLIFKQIDYTRDHCVCFP
jgi:hypothetical protein